MRAPVISDIMIGDGLAEFETTYINIKDPPFRAKGDGIADDTTAIITAIAVAPTGSTIHFPVGTYLIYQTLVIDKQITLQGEGIRGESVAVSRTRLEWAQIDGTNGMELSVAMMIDGLEIRGNSFAGHGLFIEGPVGHFVFRDMRVVLWGGDGLHADQFYINEFYNCGFNHNEGHGIYFTNANENRFYSCEANWNKGFAGLYLNGGNANFFDLDLGNGDSDWAVYFTGHCFANKIRMYYDGGTTNFAFFDEYTHDNEIWGSSGSARPVYNLGFNNKYVNGFSIENNAKEHIQSALTLVQNHIQNPSGVIDIPTGWNKNSVEITHERLATDGVSTGTCHKITWTIAGNSKTWYSDKTSALSAGDIVVIQFWAKTNRALTPGKLQIHIRDVDGITTYPTEVSEYLDVTTDWRFFTQTIKVAEDVAAGVGMYFYVWSIDSPLIVYITDIALYVNPESRINQVPFIFAGGITEHVNYPMAHTGRLDQMLRLPNLDIAPANPEPGAITMADGMNWDPLGAGTSCSKLIFYGQAILVGDDYEWAKIGATDEYSCGLTGGGADPSFNEPDEVRIAGSTATKGVRGSLNAGEWAWGQDASTTFNTVIVRLSGDVDPDGENDGHVTAMRWTAIENEALK